MQNEVELFCPVEKKRIMAKPTFEGLIFCTNHIALAKYLLAYGVEKVCLRIVTQDVLEALFGNLVSRRRLAGHLFQDRWEDQGRGFILLPPWPPNCLGQMLTVRDFSQHLVSSSKTIRPNIPRGARCMGHCEMM